MSEKRGYSNHHVRPQSRGGRGGKTVLVPDSFHRAWHLLFENLYDRECQRFLILVCAAMDRNSLITPEDLAKYRRISLGANDHHNSRPDGMPLRREYGEGTP